MFATIRRKSLLAEWQKRRAYVPELGERHTVCAWVREGDDSVSNSPDPLIDMYRYGELLSLLPDKIVQNLERARMSRDGRMPVIKAGLGYEELLASVIVDGTAIASSSTENILFPDLLLPANYMQPGGIPGRTLRWHSAGRVTTLTTAGTMTYNFGSGTTAVTIPTVSWAKSGAIVADATAQTNNIWSTDGTVVVRSVGTAGTVFAIGEANYPPLAVASGSAANNALCMMGSAGSATPSTASFDMTLAQYVVHTAKWSLTTAYSIQGHIYLLEALN